MHIALKLTKQHKRCHAIERKERVLKLFAWFPNELQCKSKSENSIR